MQNSDACDRASAAERLSSLKKTNSDLRILLGHNWQANTEPIDLVQWD